MKMIFNVYRYKHGKKHKCGSKTASQIIRFFSKWYTEEELKELLEEARSGEKIWLAAIIWRFRETTKLNEKDYCLIRIDYE